MEKINGTWKLTDYELIRKGDREFHDDISGLLIYAPDGWFSLSLKYPENPKQPYKKDMIKNYFFGGKYHIHNSSIVEENVTHVIDNKIGEKRAVEFSLQNNELTRICFFGEDKLTTHWVRAA